MPVVFLTANDQESGQILKKVFFLACGGIAASMLAICPILFAMADRMRMAGILLKGHSKASDKHFTAIRLV